jgi:hypothetical protein
MLVIEGFWDSIDQSDNEYFVLGWVSETHDRDDLANLDGSWSRASLPKLAEIAADLGVRIVDSSTGKFIDE